MDAAFIMREKLEHETDGCFT